MRRSCRDAEKELLSRAECSNNLGTGFRRGMSRSDIRKAAYASRDRVRQRSAVDAV